MSGGLFVPVVMLLAVFGFWAVTWIAQRSSSRAVHAEMQWRRCVGVSENDEGPRVGLFPPNAIAEFANGDRRWCRIEEERVLAGMYVFETGMWVYEPERERRVESWLFQNRTGAAAEVGE